jgi:pimeloyl-ACP methyl ester carboxylesterase
VIAREQACRLGEGGELAGILSLPAAASQLGCVLVSAGLVPKHGPFRVYTQLARRLAADGLPTLRFDLSGIGDSLPARSGQALRERTFDEIRAAVDHLSATRAPGGVILAGLCSGAEDSFRYAEHDPRVVAVVLIDPFAYPVRRALPRAFALRVASRVLRSLGVYVPRPAAVGRRAVTYRYMERFESERILATLLARGVRSHFVYTGATRDAINHEGHLAAMFPGLDLGRLVTVDLLPRSDHTQFLQEDRDQLVEAIARRLRG